MGRNARSEWVVRKRNVCFNVRPVPNHLMLSCILQLYDTKGDIRIVGRRNVKTCCRWWGNYMPSF